MLAHLMVALAAASAAAPAPGAGEWLTPEQARKVVERLVERRPFLGSQDARVHPETVGLFFGKKEYEVLWGNPVLGYWQDAGFRWVGRRVRWEGIASVGNERTRAITRKAWDAAFRYVARKYGLVVDDRAPMVVSGACVGAVLEPGPKEPNRGVVLEMKIEGPKGAFLYRFGYGNPTLEGAVGGSVDLAVFLARRFGKAAK